MKVALVHDWLISMRGGERCLQVACELFPDASIYTLFHCEGDFAPEIARLPKKTSFLQRVPAIKSCYRYLLPLMPSAIERLTIPDDTDLVLSFSHAVAHGIRCPAHVPHVCYCFSPMRYAWDLRDQYFPTANDEASLAEQFKAATLGRLREKLLDRTKDWTRQAADRVTRFVSISETISDRIERCFGRQSTLIHPPVDVEFNTPGNQQRDDYYLCVSALVPYKRIELAVEACNRLQRRLVVIGTGPEEARLQKIAGPTVELLGWQSNEVIRQHYRQCRALLFPGLEDFGIVPLEAQACGAAVIAYGEGGALETVLPIGSSQMGTGLFFQEQTTAALVAAIELAEQRRDLLSASLARQHAMTFSTNLYRDRLSGLLQETVAASNDGQRKAA